jgi:uncharacterized repeat protein (TIGR01451 family)
MTEERCASRVFGELADELLVSGAGFRFQAKGRSMWPLISDGEILHVQQTDAARLKVGDIVLFRKGAEFKAHRIIRRQKENDLFITRGDASCEADGAITGGQIVGKIIAKECANSGTLHSLDSLGARLSFFAAETRRQARKYLSRRLGFARPALLLCVLAGVAIPAAHAQVALDVAAPFVLTQAANATGGNTTYQGAITGGAANAYTGVVFTVSGFANANNNGTFICAASTINSLTLANANGVLQTQAATAASLATTSLAGRVTQAANTVTLSHNTIAGSNLLLVVGVSMNISSQASFNLTSALAASGGNTVYNGTITGGAANAYVGLTFTVAGFTFPAAADNGTFTCTASTATTLTLSNAAGVAKTQGTTATTSAMTSVSGVTYNGVALTRAGFHNDSTNVRRVEMWYLVNPPSGANDNVVVTENIISAAATVGTVVGATSFSGVDQTTPIRAFASNDSNGAGTDAANVTVASGANDLVIDTLAIDGSHTISSASGTQVQQWALTSGAAGTDAYGFGSTHGGAASVPMSEILSAAIIWADAAVSIEPSQTDLSVSVSGTSALFPTNLSYTITVKNNGPTAIPSSGSVPGTTVTLTDTLASGLTWVSSTPSQGSCSGTTTITCNLVTNTTGIAVGASVTITVVVTPGAPGGYPNHASVTSSTADLVTANNSSTGVAYSDFAACATSTLTAGGTLTGTLNTYFPGTATANAGATSITLGTSTGAATAIANGDLVLIIQMQDAAINSSNSGSYGDGISGSGSTNLNNAGAYEYATATNAVPVGGGTLTVTAAGPGGGLLYTYTSAAATVTQGARTFQVVRVPNFTTATLSNTLTGSAWNGSTGGILALNLSGALTLNSATVHMDGLGFRGGSGMDLIGSLANLTQVANAAGGVTVYTGTISGGATNTLVGTTFIVTGFANAANNGTFVATASTNTTLTLANVAGVAETHAGTASISPGATNSDYLFTSPVSYAGAAIMGADGAKGEGIAGTPHWVQSGTNNVNTNQTYAEGYPNGSMGRGAPGNAGGGGTDGDPSATAAPGGNDQNAGGGGGSNGGIGGQGGDTWSSNLTTGGFGGSAFPADINRVVLGGGGGAGSSNNNNSTSSSSAAAGGGIIMIRAGSLTGTATITANGANGFNNTASDAGGGGGAGGSIIILTGTGGETGLTLQAQGGTGGNAWQGQAYSNVNRHGPGGGGAGGVVLTSSVTGTPTISVTGGASGTTLTGPSVTYGATAGTAGLSVTNLTLTSSPGQHSATICTDMAITKSGSPQPVLQNTTLTYTVRVTNNGPQTATGVVAVDTLPAQVTYISSVTTLGSCSQSGGVVNCNLGTMASGLTATITITVTAATPSLALNTAVVNSTTPDPTLANNTATFTSTIEFPSAVKLNSFVAGQTGPAVLVTWRSGAELHNLGYNVYRESGGNKVLLTPSLIAGSALSMRETVEQHGAKSYAWIDHSPVNGGLYWLEDVDLNGSRTMYGPISVESGPAITRTVAGSAMLSEMARSNATLGRASGAQSHVREAVATPVVSKAAINTGFQLAAQPAVKIFVDHEGWYRITQPQLVAAGLNPNLPASSLHLFAEGVEQPISVTGAASNFGSQGAIEFYGTAIDTPFSGQRVYWLMSSAQPGLRIPAPSGAGSPGPQAQSFVQTLELKPRTTYFAALLTENTDNFFGPLISPTAAVQTLNVANLAPGGATIQVVLQGVTQGQPHDVTVAVNGATLGNIAFTGQQQGKGQFTIPAGILTNGANTITLTAQQGSSDLSLIDHIDVSFYQTLTAQSDLLKFTAAAGDSVTVTGFAQSPTRLMDISNPAQPFAVAYTVSSQGGGYALQTTVPWTSSGNHTLLALADDRLALPVSLAPHQPSTLHAAQAGAGVVILTAPQFAVQMQPLAALHRAEGRPVAVVTADQVYDEFNFGERTPYAVKNFLQTATTAWTNKPHYLLLGGDASIDPRDYLGFGFFDFVPTKIVVTSELKTASDDWFSDFSGTGYAQIATGRIPARTVSDAQTMVGKIFTYANGPTASWTNDTMLVADTDDPSVSFSQASLAVQKLLPPTMNVSDVFAGTLGTGTARQDIIAGINSGQVLVNYNGHGSVEVWGGGLFDDTAAASLTNGNRLPVFVMMNCLNGFFQDVFTQSLAESLLLSQNGGAVAVWASSGLTAPDPQFQMDQALVKTLFAQPSIALGDAVQVAKSGIADADTRKTFILFGDPLMRLKPSGVAAQPHVSKP